MKVKYFYSPAIFSSQPKLYVLTDDCILYSESRDFSLVHIDQIKVDSFQNFNPKNHETEDHPILLEIGETEATKISEDLRPNWIRRYLSGKRVFSQNSVTA